MKNRDQFAIADNGPSSSQSRRNLGWVVRKIVINLDPATFTVKLETALGATEGFDGAQCRLGLETESDQNGKRSSGVDGIV